MVTQTDRQDPQETRILPKEDPKEDVMMIVAKAEVIVAIDPQAEVLVDVLQVVFQETAIAGLLLVTENQDSVPQTATADLLLVIENQDLVPQTVIAGLLMAIENPLLAHPTVMTAGALQPTEDLNAETTVVLPHPIAEKVAVTTEKEAINVAITGLPKEEPVLVPQEITTTESPIGAKESLTEMDFNVEKEKMTAEEKDPNAIAKEEASEGIETKIEAKEVPLEAKDQKEGLKGLNSEMIEEEIETILEAATEDPKEKPRDLVMKILIEDLMAKEAALLAPDPVPIVPKGKNAEAISVAMTAMQEAVIRLAKDLTEGVKEEKEVPEVSATEIQEATEVQVVSVKEAPMAKEAPVVKDPQEEEKDL